MEGGISSTPINKPQAPTTGNTNALPPKDPSNKKKSEIWDHFSVMDDCDPSYPRAACNYCGKNYGCHTERDGTSNLVSHLRNQCPKY